MKVESYAIYVVYGHLARSPMRQKEIESNLPTDTAITRACTSRSFFGSPILLIRPRIRVATLNIIFDLVHTPNKLVLKTTQPT
jgi:hypothetical protein